MKKIITLLLLSVFLASCHNEAPEKQAVYGTPDHREVKCVSVSKETQDKLKRASAANPDIVLEFLGTETILADVSSCFLKVRITNAKDPSFSDVYSLFNVVRERTEEDFSSLEELEAALENIKAQSK